MEKPESLKMKNTLDDFDFSFQPSIDKRQIDELATMCFLENGENVVFLGPPRLGIQEDFKSVRVPDVFLPPQLQPSG